MECNKQNKLTCEIKKTHIYREQTDSCPREGVLQGWVKKVNVALAGVAQWIECLPVIKGLPVRFPV